MHHKFLKFIYVHNTYLNIEELLSEHWRSVIDWVSGTVEGTTKHLNTHGHTEYITCELTSGGPVVNIGGSFEDLHAQNVGLVR